MLVVPHPEEVPASPYTSCIVKDDAFSRFVTKVYEPNYNWLR